MWFPVKKIYLSYNKYDKLRAPYRSKAHLFNFFKKYIYHIINILKYEIIKSQCHTKQKIINKFILSNNMIKVLLNLN